MSVLFTEIAKATALGKHSKKSALQPLDKQIDVFKADRFFF